MNFSHKSRRRHLVWVIKYLIAAYSCSIAAFEAGEIDRSLKVRWEKWDAIRLSDGVATGDVIVGGARGARGARRGAEGILVNEALSLTNIYAFSEAKEV